MQTFDQGNAVGGNPIAHTAKMPTPPRTEAVSALHSELEQRRAEAQAMAEYHAGEAGAWQAVVGAATAALDSLKQQPVDGQF